MKEYSVKYNRGDEVYGISSNIDEDNHNYRIIHGIIYSINIGVVLIYTIKPTHGEIELLEEDNIFDNKKDLLKRIDELI